MVSVLVSLSPGLFPCVCGPISLVSVSLYCFSLKYLGVTKFMTHFYVLLEDTCSQLICLPTCWTLSLSQLKYHTWIQLIRATGDFPLTPGFDATFHGSSHLHQQVYFSPSMRSHNSAFYANTYSGMFHLFIVIAQLIRYFTYTVYFNWINIFLLKI